MIDADPLDRSGMRRHNLGLVLRAVADGTDTSRTAVAAATGLHKTTVSSLVTELIDRRLLREIGTAPTGGVGRPAVALELDGDRFVALGLEINVDHLAFTAVDLLGRVRDEGFVQHDNRSRTATDTVAALAELVGDALQRIRGEGLLPVGATLGLPGLVDPTRGVLLLAPNLGWQDVAVGERLHDALDSPDFTIGIENEANLAAIAEGWQGAGQDHQDFLYVSGYIGVGAGIITDGQLHRGATSFGGEFGHMTLEFDGPPCACGSRGCVEAVVGLEALLRRAGHDPDPAGQPPSDSGAVPAPAGRLIAAAERGEPRTLEALEELGGKLGAGLASAANLLGSQAVVLGGYYAALFPWLRGPIEQELTTRVLAAPWSPIEVLRSGIPEGAAVRGAASLSLRSLLDDPAGAPEG